MNPQTPNQAPFFGRKISKTGVNVTQATDNQLILKEDYDQGNTIYYDDSGIPNVLIGKRPLTGVRGFYVAAPDIDVTKATDDQLIFNSANNVFKIVKSSKAIITIPSTPGDDYGDSITVTHNLGYLPAYIVYVIPPATYITGGGVVGNVLVPFFDYRYFDSASGFGIPGWHINGRGDVVELSTTSIKFGLSWAIDNGHFTGIWTFKYYLLQETAN